MFGLIHLPDGGFEYVRNYEDFASLVRERLGFEAEEIVRELIRQADYNAVKADSDLLSYEMTMEGMREGFVEIDDRVAAIRREMAKGRVNKREVAWLLDVIESRVAEYL
ncbi:hypothetical protein [Paenibacillus cisolokensis]|nr:hypothetical protein [Paenibacillus cisolokensis]